MKTAAFATLLLIPALCLTGIASAQPRSNTNTKQPLQILVMDPLAAPLSCACVKGSGQRDYNALAKHLSAQLQQPVNVTFEESIQLALPRVKAGFDLVIGKYAMVQFDAKATGQKLQPIALLSDRTGSTTITGVFLVRTGDTAKSIADLKQRKTVLGPEENSETNALAAAALLRAGVLAGQFATTAGSIEEAVFAVTDEEADAAIVPAFMPPMLEACGKVERGSLKQIGSTRETPFVAVTVRQTMPAARRDAIFVALQSVADDAKLLDAMESKTGFHRFDGKPPAGATAGWTDFRGPGRNGLSNAVPATLPAKPEVLWKAKTTGPALAGIAATSKYVVVPDKDAELTTDIFRCFDAKTGAEVWTLKYPAKREVSYTNAPRTTPIIKGDRVFLLGALGDLHCIRLHDGKVIWKTNIIADNNAKLLPWGCSSTPLLVDGKLIVNPGAKDASLVALDPANGKTLWKSPGNAAAYGAFTAAKFNGKTQAVGYDSGSLGGWDVATGKRLWNVTPGNGSDFNVPSPLITGDKILVATENNATRIYSVKQDKANAKPVATNEDLAPDTCSPIAINGRVYGSAYGALYCLSMKDHLKTVWMVEDDLYYDHSNMIAGNNRVLIYTTSAQLLLIRADVDKYEVVSHWKPFTAFEDPESMSHPAIADGRLYVRIQQELQCIKLPPVSDEKK